MSAPVAEPLVAADLVTHAQFNPALNRKAQNASAFFGYYKSAPLITKLVAPNGQWLKPASYRSPGRVSDDGFEFGFPTLPPWPCFVSPESLALELRWRYSI